MRYTYKDMRYLIPLGDGTDGVVVGADALVVNAVLDLMDEVVNLVDKVVGDDDALVDVVVAGAWDEVPGIHWPISLSVKRLM